MAELDKDAALDAVEVIPEEEVRLCLFTIGEDAYALPVEMLTEIIIPQKIFPVPTTPPQVLGVINLRGNIVPIVDIRHVLNLPNTSQPAQAAIVRHGQLTVGLMVDSVTEIASVPVSSLLAVPPEVGASAQAAGRNRFFKAVVQRELRAAALLDMDRLLEALRLS